MFFVIGDFAKRVALPVVVAGVAAVVGAAFAAGWAAKSYSDQAKKQ